MNILSFNVGNMDNLSYLIEGDRNIILIDPSFGITEFSKLSKNKDLNILITHGHYDHVMDVPKLIELFINTKIFFNSYDSFLLPFKLNEFIDISTKEEIFIEDLKITILKTPGHSPGSVCYLIDKHLFTGDTLFYDCCGRVDLPGSDPKEMRKSLLKISSLEDDTIIHPGHEYGKKEFSLSTVRKNNPFLKYANDETKFLSII